MRTRPPSGTIAARMLLRILVSPAYIPFDRTTPPDRYWAAKRLMAVDDATLSKIIASARMPEDATGMLHASLQQRRQRLVTHGMMGVTPIEPSAVAGGSLWLRDRAIGAGIADANETRYEIAFLDQAGRARAPERRVDAGGPITAIGLPTGLEGLLILHVRAIRRGEAAPRFCDIHLVLRGDSARVLAVRH